METIIKQSADGIVLSKDNIFDTTQGKVFINNHEITDIDTFFKVAEENTRLLEQVKKQKEINQKAIEYIKERFYFNEETGKYSLLHTFDKCNVKELLDILNEVSE